MAKRSQAESILRHLRRRGTITPIEALQHYGCFRLAARVHDLRKRGIDVKVRQKKGTDATYAEYYL